MDLLKSFSQITVESPVDKIIRQIRDLIKSGHLKPGDRIPPQRQLCERLGVGRTQLRDALRKLEFYGILKTHPQSGTVVAGMGIPALEGLITDMLNLRGNDFRSLVETRYILETHITQNATKHRTEADIKAIEKALIAHEEKINRGEDAVEEDLLLHVKIADAGKNSVLKSLMLIIVPDIVHYFKKQKICNDASADVVINQHKEILQYIVDKNPDKAVMAIKKHLKNVSEFVKTLDIEGISNRTNNGI